MRKLLVPALATVAALALLIVLPGDTTPVQASHGQLNVHVHDDYYHPAGRFIVGNATDHNLAKAACQQASPDPQCDALIHVGDSITWVSPSPLAANPHTVTECTDGTFNVCGPNVSASNPIGDSSVRNPPNPGPSGWPYGPVQFNSPGTYYYRCEVHPAVMRGRVLVVPLGVGGSVEQITGGEGPRADASGSSGGGTLVIAVAVGAAAVSLAAGGWYGRRRAARQRIGNG